MTLFSIEMKNGTENGIDETFKNFLGKNGLDALFILKKTNNGFYIPALISDPTRVKGVNPFAGVMTINMATLVSNITRLSPAPSKIGVVLRPCEYRALVEIVKLKQVALDNLVIIVTDCRGTIPMAEYLDIAGNKTIDEIITMLNHDEKLRTSCLTCEYCLPEGDSIDIKIHSIGSDMTKHMVFEGITEKGTELIKKANGVETQLSDAMLKSKEEIIARRKKNNSEIIAREKIKFTKIDNITTTLNTCIACHNCMDACPICYCKECFFESPTFDYEAEKYLRWTERKGSIRMPVGTLLFHLGRLNHMAVSCVGCGMCEQACPAKIPLLSLFKSVGQDLQKIFEYTPGKSVKESLPLIVYQEEEYEPRD